MNDDKKWLEETYDGDMKVGAMPNNVYGTTNADQKNQNQESGSASGSAGWTATPYTPSDLVTQAQTLLQQHMNNQPGQYASSWSGQLTDLLGQIQNRPEFKYDVNSDALWNQYKDQYLQMGQQAMMDTIGQASAMTGGYGNSYAQSVGQQAYNGYMQGLNDKIPDLYQIALNKYQMDNADLLNQYGILADAEAQEYGRYMDAVNQYYAQLDRLQNQYDTERNYDYSQYLDDRNFDYSQYLDDRNFQYQTGRDTVADSQWQAEFDEAVRQFNFANSLGEFAPTGGGYVTDSENEKTGGGNPNVDNAYYKAVVTQDYYALKSSGAARQADQYLRAAVDSGVISLDDATDLRNSRFNVSKQKTN